MKKILANDIIVLLLATISKKEEWYDRWFQKLSEKEHWLLDWLTFNQLKEKYTSLNTEYIKSLNIDGESILPNWTQKSWNEDRVFLESNYCEYNVFLMSVKINWKVLTIKNHSEDELELYHIDDYYNRDIISIAELYLKKAEKNIRQYTEIVNELKELRK